MKNNEVSNSDGFITVTYRRKYNKKNQIVCLQKVPDISCTFDISKFNENKEDLKCSEFFMYFKDDLNSVLKNLNCNVEFNQEETLGILNLTERIESVSISHIGIVCYGLGHFTSCLIARYQLALLMILRDILQPSVFDIYDPIFSTEEKTVLRDLSLNVLNINEGCKRTASNQTIFFMPHCDLPLYNNLLWANWKKEKLSKLIIIGNSFQKYNSFRTENFMKENAIYVYFASQFASEIKIKNIFKFSDIFNDLSLHYFQSNDLSKVPNHIWNNADEPVYDIDDGIILNGNQLQITY
ncbi:SRR1-like protein [Trichonephila clavipes]|nr:SRR1-like protein [Trichonephila clavipes]